MNGLRWISQDAKKFKIYDSWNKVIAKGIIGVQKCLFGQNKWFYSKTFVIYQIDQISGHGNKFKHVSDFLSLEKFLRSGYGLASATEILSHMTRVILDIGIIFRGPAQKITYT